MAITAPAKSAGIEGTGSGLQMDVETQKLDQRQAGPLEEDIEDALKDRKQRGEELLIHLARFASIDFYQMNSTPSVIVKEDETKLERTITMKGRLSEGLGKLQIVLDVRESIAEGGKEGPQIVKLDIEVADELYRALGEQHLVE